MPATASPPTPAAATTARASLLVLGAAAFMSQANARVIDSLLHVVATDFQTVPARAAIVVSAFALPYALVGIALARLLPRRTASWLAMGWMLLAAMFASNFRGQRGNGSPVSL